MCKKKDIEEEKTLDTKVEVSKEEKEVRIPSEKVLFVGGQENFINKMRKLYPDWTYLGSEERNCKKVKGEYSLAIIKANHCSHNIIERALAHCGDVPVIYSNCTNVDRTVAEIKSSIKDSGLSFKASFEPFYFGLGGQFNANEYLMRIREYLKSA